MEFLKLLLERLLSWPFITFSVFLLFKKPLSKLLERLSTLKAGKEGFSLETTAAASSIQAGAKVETGLNPEAEARLKEVKSVGISPSVQLRENLIREDLQKMNLAAPQQETTDLLIHHLAIAQATASAERIYRTIFGSQIALLKSVNTCGGTAPRGALESVYEVAKSRFPDLYGNYLFQQWINYMLSQGLLATNDNELFSITVDGKEFLKWMTDAGVSEQKPF